MSGESEHSGMKRGVVDIAEGALGDAEATPQSKRAKDDDSDGEGDDGGGGKFQKRMMALQFGYVGTGYSGLQK